MCKLHRFLRVEICRFHKKEGILISLVAYGVGKGFVQLFC